MSSRHRRIQWFALAVVGCALTLLIGAILFLPQQGKYTSASEGTLQLVSASPSTARPVMVHVVGAVRSPGLYDLPAGARIGDAIRAAGGLTSKADHASVNLAGKAIDGTQIVVAKRGEQQAARNQSSDGSGGERSTGTTGAASVSLNQATSEDLQTLDKIGPALAERIIAFRSEHGGFTSVEQLLEVSGIGEKIFAGLKAHVTL